MNADASGRQTTHSLTSRLPASYVSPFCGLIEQRTRSFVGRKRVLAAIDAFVKVEECGYFWLQAAPGLGKTSIAAHLADQRAWPHYFFSAVSGTRRISGLIDTLDLQLRAALPDYRGAQGSSLATLLAHTSAVAESAARPIVVVVDGVDEAEELDAESNVLGLPDALGSGVIVVLTVRSRAYVNAFAQVPSLIFDLDAGSEENLEDASLLVKRFFAAHRELAPTSKSERDALVARIVQKSGGNFMYLRFLLDGAVRERRIDLTELPSGLDEYYNLHWARMRKRAGPRWEIWRLVLAALAVAESPISAPVLAKLTNVSVAEVNSALRAWGQFLQVMAGRPPEYLLYHKTFADYLRGRDEVGDLDLSQARKTVTDASWKLWLGADGG